MKKLNYFSSLWIANLGVDPTLAILFFLFLPAFFFLKFLLHLVCIVLDAISISLRFVLFNFRPTYLSIMALFVKIFLVSANYNISAASQSKSEINDLFIAKGEQLTLSVKNLEQFSVGNKEVIKHVFKKKKSLIYIKGKSVGFSDLVIWTQTKKKLIYHIYVLSKKERLSKIKIAESFKRLNLNVRISGELILVSGEIENMNQFLYIHKLLKLKNKNLILNLSLNTKLRNQLYELIYTKLYKFGAQKVICNNDQIFIECSIAGVTSKSQYLERLKEKYNLKFNFDLTNLKDENYKISFKIIQVQKVHNANTKVALSSISASLLDLIRGNQLSLIEGEQTNLSNLNINATLLAEPRSIITLNDAQTLSLGGELPFQSQKENHSITQWKFYGLKLKTSLKNQHGKPYLKYESNLTIPSKNQAIQGSKGKSGVYLSLGQYLKLFEIGHLFNQEQINSIPLLGEIPFLKHLFSQNIDSYTFKHIICFVKLEKINE